MFKRKPPPPDPGLERVIADCESELLSFDANSKEYKETLARYETLRALKAEIQPKRVSPDTLLLAAANIFGILLIVGHERANIVTSKALSFVKKLT